MSILIPKYKDFQQERVIGEHTIYLPDPPNIKLINYKDLPTDKQFFRRDYMPNDWSLLPKEERSAFANKHWDIRGREGDKGDGFWFMNGGKLEWMSPNHYFYSNWWRIGKVQIPKEYMSDPRDLYYPFFTDGDRDWHYVTEHCFYDKNCGGLFTIEGRRMGKTYRVSAFQYEKISKTHDAKGGIQSRDDTDSYNVFEKIIFGWRNLPPFFKPIDTGNSNPVTSLVFDEPKKINTKVTQKVYSDILHSWIDYGNASEGYYDGKEQLINIQDEIGKIAVKRGVNLLERIRVVVECCFIMGQKVGMILATTTVEEMEKAGGKQAKNLWLRCTTLDIEAKLHPSIFPQGTALDDLGFTNSKLKRYFKPSYKGFLGLDENGVCFVDRYGYSDEERTKKFFLKKRANKKGAELASEKRKFPIEINDCWVSDVKKSTYDTDKVEQQLQHNQTIPANLKVRGNFVWKNGVPDTEVEWHPCDNGRWEVLWMPPVDKRNNFVMVAGKRSPANKDTGCFGTDPYDNKTTVDDRKSNAASYGLRRYDPMYPESSGIFISKYVNRPPLPETMWEDQILQSVFYGWEILIESNKIGTINHVRRRGYYNYLMDRPEETETTSSRSMEDKKGIPMSGDDARQALIYATESYIINNVGLIEKEGEEPRMGRCYFDELLNDWLEFDFEQKWTKFDSMVGAGLAILGTRTHIKVKPKPVPLTLFPTYNNSGMESVKNIK